MAIGINGCIHYEHDWKRRQCDNPVWIDENGNKYKRCQEHICVFCHGNVKSKNKRDKIIGTNNKGSLYCCRDKTDCIKKQNKVIFYIKS